MKYLTTLSLLLFSAACATAQLSFNQIILAPGLTGPWPQNMKSINGMLYFQAYKSGDGDELWTSDGTQAGTQYIKDINPGTKSSKPNGFTSFGGKIYFKAEGATGAVELWETDGTAAGTKAVTQPTVNGPSLLGDIYVLNGKMYFVANTKNEGNELWESDGTTAGTKLLKDIKPGANGSEIKYVTLFNNKLYFAANNGSDGEELWMSDGTVTGTAMVLNININSSNAYIGKPMVLNNILYFTGSDATGRKLFASDGTAAGTSIVTALYTSSNYPFGEEVSIAAYNNLYFVVNSPSEGIELWTSDGTAAGTRIVKDVEPGSGSSTPVNLIAYNNNIYFAAGRYNVELYCTDGTAAGTTVLSSFEKNGSPATYIYDLTVFNGCLYFVSHSNLQNSTVLYATGKDKKLQTITPNTYTVRKPIYSSGSICLHDTSMCIAAAFDTAEGNELWVMNGKPDTATGIRNTEVGTTVFSLHPNPANNLLHISSDKANKTAVITLINTTGQTVLTEKMHGTATLSLKGIAPGLYYVVIETADTSETQKLVIQ